MRDGGSEDLEMPTRDFVPQGRVAAWFDAPACRVLFLSPFFFVAMCFDDKQ